MSGVHLGRVGRRQLDLLLREAERSPLTYDHVGSTLREGAPPGVTDRTFRRSVVGTVAAATAALHDWAAHDGIRARVHPAAAPITVDTTLLVAAPFGPFEIVVPDRIVAVVDEPDRYGFAYGTLRTHAEAGEELFLAEETPHGLDLTVRVHARPDSVLARAGGPAVRLLQAAAARRYLAAWAAAIAGLR